MYHVASIHVYDVMDQIYVTAVLATYDSLNPVEPVKDSVTVTIQGDGEPEPRRWLRESLIGLIEGL